jgi:hypothetical protein
LNPSKACRYEDKAAWRGLAALVLILAAVRVPAQTPLFADSAPITLTIDGPFRTVVSRAPRSTDPYPATLILHGQRDQTFAITLSARGLSRRTRGFCDFPPLRLDFDKSALAGTLFEGQNRLKLVTHCKTSGTYARLAVLEYLIYRFYNELTPLSFRVRAAQISYRDSDRGGRAQTFFGFLIEDIDDTAARNGRIALEVGSGQIPSAALDPDAAALVSLFHFMIGNLDWDLNHGPEGGECCHNGKLISFEAAPKSAVVSVPYDFDHAGFVDAPYAEPPDQIRINTVRTRYYRGLCLHNQALRNAIAVFRAERADLLALIDTETRLPEARRDTARRYLDSFYEILDDPERFDRQVLRRCR